MPFVHTYVNDIFVGNFSFIPILRLYKVNLVPRVSHLTALGGGQIRDPGNEVAPELINRENRAINICTVSLKVQPVIVLDLTRAEWRKSSLKGLSHV